MSDHLVLISFILLCLIVSAFFSASETALTAASDARMHALAKRGNKKAGLITKLRAQKDRMVTSILIGNNLVNVMSTSLATSLAILLAGDGGSAIAEVTLVMTVLLVIFSEVTPKTYALNHADRFALMVARPIYLIVLVLTPLTIGLNAAIRRVIRTPDDADAQREEELRGMIAMHSDGLDDAERREEAAMLASVLDLGEVTVEEVMTHRGAVVMIDADADPAEIIKQIIASPFTRHPVYRDKHENIIGVLHAKELLRNVSGDGKGNIAATASIASLTAEPYFIPETTLLFDQLQAFRQRREHFAIVVDEYGDFRGIISLEDILEEIVGDIDDEHDEVMEGIKPDSEGAYRIDGDVTIRDLNRALGWSLPDEAANTIAGLLLHESRMIPRTGQEFRFHKTHFRVLKRTGNRLDKLLVWDEYSMRHENAEKREGESAHAH